MSIEDIDTLVFIKSQVALITKHDFTEISDSTIIYGEDGLFDSMGLIELCIRLEDFATELGFEFNWTSNSAMSNSKSIFHDILSLHQHFISQKKTA